MFKEFFQLALDINDKFREVNLSVNSYNMGSGHNARFDCYLYDGKNHNIDSKKLLKLLLEMYHSVNNDVTVKLTLKVKGRTLRINEMAKLIHVVEETTEGDIEAYVTPKSDLISDWDNSKKSPRRYGGFSDIYED
jgi:hypothetical protein